MTDESQKNTDHEAFLRLFTGFEGNLRAFVASLLPTWNGVAMVAAIVLLATGVFLLWPERSVLTSGDSDRIAVVTQSVAPQKHVQLRVLVQAD